MHKFPCDINLTWPHHPIGDYSAAKGRLGCANSAKCVPFTVCLDHHLRSFRLAAFSSGLRMFLDTVTTVAITLALPLFP